MPQLLLLGLAGAAVYFGYRAFVREAERVTAQTRKARAKQKGEPTKKLVFDEKTGKYHPKDMDE